MDAYAKQLCSPTACTSALGVMKYAKKKDVPHLPHSVYPSTSTVTERYKIVSFPARRHLNPLNTQVNSVRGEIKPLFLLLLLTRCIPPYSPA